MILVTGALGFIGWNMVRRIMSSGGSVLASDCLDMAKSQVQLQRLNSWKSVHTEFLDLNDVFNSGKLAKCSGVIHLGAISSSVNKDWDALQKLNLEFTKDLFYRCTLNGIPFIYASSASTYGQSGDCDDSDELVSERPGLSMYARSKWLFDRWALSQVRTPPSWAGLKFFCVYGPEEDHKGPQASIFHKSVVSAFSEQAVTLFETKKSPERDFVHVDDVCNSCLHFLNLANAHGQYNVGTGMAYPFEMVPGLVNQVLGELGLPNRAVIQRAPFPPEIWEHYQHITCAKSPRALDAGYTARILPHMGAALMIKHRQAILKEKNAEKQAGT